MHIQKILYYTLNSTAITESSGNVENTGTVVNVLKINENIPTKIQKYKNTDNWEKRRENTECSAQKIKSVLWGHTEQTVKI